MTFRARLLDLANEHEALQHSHSLLRISHDDAVKEVQALKSCLSSGAPPAHSIEQSIVPHYTWTWKQRIEAAKPPPAAPCFDTETCDDGVETDASLFQLLGRECDMGNQSINHGTDNENVNQTVPPIVDGLSGACALDKPTDMCSLTSTKYPRAAERGNGIAGSSEKVRVEFNRSNVHTAKALWTATFNRRKCSLVRLGLLHRGSLLHVDSVDTTQQSQEDTELDEKIQSFWYTFSALDKHGTGISADILNDFVKELPGVSADRYRINRFERALKDFNEYCAQMMGDDCDRPDHTSLSFYMFIELMLMGDVENQLGSDLANVVLEIRNMFIFEQATKVVSSLTRVSDEDIHATGTGLHMKLMYTDAVVSSIILLNALTVAVSTDVHPNWKGWDMLEAGFVLFFVCEMIVKTRISGPTAYFYGDDRLWNWFDCFIVAAAIIDLIVNLFFDFDGWNIATLRLLRVLKVARVVRILRLRMFKELTLMVQGVIAGMRTLFWACALLIFVVFCLGMVLRQTVGSETSTVCSNHEARSSDCSHIDVYREDLFSTVPRSMFTVLRCFTSGCESRDGTPLTLHLWEEYGWPIVLAYTLWFLFVTFGLFNLIMAIFVENTMEAARFNEQKRQSMRTFENIRVAKLLYKLMMRFCTTDAESDQGDPAIQFNLHVTTDHFRKVIVQPETERVLEDLGIAVADPRQIFGVLDADGSGSIDLNELTIGFMKLRGPADKGDAVASLLKMETVLKSVRSLESRVLPILNTMATSPLFRSCDVKEVDHGEMIDCHPIC